MIFIDAQLVYRPQTDVDENNSTLTLTGWRLFNDLSTNKPTEENQDLKKIKLTSNIDNIIGCSSALYLTSNKNIKVFLLENNFRFQGSYNLEATCVQGR